MGKKKETAEQKLLKMIEASSGGGALASTQKKVTKKQNALSIIKTANGILIVGVLIAGVLLFSEISSGVTLLGAKMNFSVDRRISRQQMSVQDILPSVQRLSYYLASIKSRNIFQPYEEKTLVESAGGEKVAVRRIVEKTKNLRLVGVSWLDRIETASVMVEDTEKKTTHFLRKGERVGDIVVKTIYADSALLGYDDEEIIIRYDKPQN